MQLLLWLIVAIGCVIAFFNWRYGILVCIFVGLIQDPVRKVTPGVPAYLTVAFSPIYLSAFWGLLREKSALSSFFNWFPQIRRAAVLFGVALIVPVFLTLLYGFRAVPLVIIGLIFYLGGVPGVLMGFNYAHRGFPEWHRVLVAYAAIAAVMLVSVPFDLAGYGATAAVLGPMSDHGEWMRFIDGYAVRMISGAFRSSEIMGWHAMTLVMVSAYFAVTRTHRLFVWLPLGMWGLYGALISGRRKFVVALLIYMLLLLIISRAKIRMRALLCVVAAMILIVPITLRLVPEGHVVTAKSGFSDAGNAAVSQTATGPLGLLSQVGPFGYGVGTKTQGTQHLGLRIKTPLLEGGLEKILIEIGILGAAAGAFLAVVVGLNLLQCVRQERAREDGSAFLAAVSCLLFTNAMMFVYSFQIFGDPAILCLFALLTGAVLSQPRLAGAEQTAYVWWFRPMPHRKDRSAPVEPIVTTS